MAQILSTEASRNASGQVQIVAMNVGEEIYGVAIEYVHTVILPQPITAVPRTPRHVRGVINLRGRVVPVVDLRTRFGLPESTNASDIERRIVMVDVEGHQTGLIVDSVSEVIMLPAECIEPPSEYLAPETAYVSAIARAPGAKSAAGPKEIDATANERLILLLDVHKAILGADMYDQIAEEEPALAA